MRTIWSAVVVQHVTGVSNTERASGAGCCQVLSAGTQLGDQGAEPADCTVQGPYPFSCSIVVIHFLRILCNLLLFCKTTYFTPKNVDCKGGDTRMFSFSGGCASGMRSALVAGKGFGRLEISVFRYECATVAKREYFVILCWPQPGVG